MQTYREAFDDNPYFHCPTEGPMIKGCRLSNPQKRRYRRTLVWRAMTPTGKPSRYFHVENTNSEKNEPTYPLPKLRRGYTWKGPFLYDSGETWETTSLPEDRYPIEDWRAEVAAGDTVLGYKEWLEHQMEGEDNGR